MVLTIIATVAVIGFGVFQRVKQQVLIDHARGDLAALSQALELYRRQYGDYPQTADTPEKFYQALSGRLGPTGNDLPGRSLLPAVPVALQDPVQPEAMANAFADPWGRAYQYVFFTRQSGTAPLQRGFVLFSFGPRNSTESLPTRADVVPSTSGAQGGIVSIAPIHRANIYAGE